MGLKAVVMPRVATAKQVNGVSIKKTDRYETSWGNLMVMSSDGTTILLKSPDGRTGRSRGCRLTSRSSTSPQTDDY